MQEITTARARPARTCKAPAPQALQYPDLLTSDHPLCWVANYLRSVAELEALQAHIDSIFRRPNPSKPLCHGLLHGAGALRNDVKQAAAWARDDGKLLYLHPRTTVLQGGAA